MSSDCFTVRVAAVNGTELTLDVLTLTSGGVTDLCVSRSFALRLLDDSLRRAADVVPDRWTEQGRAVAQQLFERAERTALRAALPGDSTRWYNFTLAVVLTDARWGEHVEAGLVFPTTGFEG